MRVISLVVGLGLAATLGLMPRTAVGQGLMISGYADLEFNVENIDGDDQDIFLDNHHFNIIGLGKLVENVYATAEIEFEHAGDEIALEFGYVSYTGIKNLTISAGKFIVPFGRFNKDLHPTWINKMPDRPHGFRNIFPQTYSDVGVWLAGGAPVGTVGTRFTYDLFVVNGLLGDEGANIRGMRDNVLDELSAGGHDNDKSFGARLGLDFAPQGFDIGASVMAGNYLDDPDENLTLLLWGFDLAYHNKGFEFRGEGVWAEQELMTGDNLTKRGGYVQLAYLTEPRVEPIARFSFRDMPDAPGVDEDARRVSFGLSYYFSANAAVRLAYHVNIEDSGFQSDNDGLVGQITMSF